MPSAPVSTRGVSPSPASSPFRPHQPGRAALRSRAIAYFVLQTVVVAEHGPDSAMASALGRDLKGKLSPVLYATGIAFAFVSTWIAISLYVVVALMWLIPDRRLAPVASATGP